MLTVKVTGETRGQETSYRSPSPLRPQPSALPCLPLLRGKSQTGSLTVAALPGMATINLLEQQQNKWKQLPF